MSENPLIPKNAKIAPEDVFRKKIIARATYMGCGYEVKQILAKYDNLLKYCTNEQERQNIAYLGVCEISKYMDCTSLTINGNVVFDDNLSIEEVEKKR